jgi:isoquinoline 1-oxidoreductase alpha subunit
MELKINGQNYDVSDDNGVLLWAIRDEIGLTGTKFGCGAGICGACTVHVDGVATRSCITSIADVVGKEITTIEGLSDGETMHPVQEAFLTAQAPQCAWCMPGQMMTASAFLAENPNPNDDDINEAMNRNYCRCGCYVRIREAVKIASIRIQEVA